MFLVLTGLLCSLDDLSANAGAGNRFGYGWVSIESPQWIVSILSSPVTVSGTT